MIICSNKIAFKLSLCSRILAVSISLSHGQIPHSMFLAITPSLLPPPMVVTIHPCSPFNSLQPHPKAS